MGYLDNIKAAVFPSKAPEASPDNPNSRMNFQKQPPAPAPKGNIGPDGNPINSPDPDPNAPDPSNTNDNKQPEDRFAKFSKMWDNPKDPEKAPSFTLDPKQLDSIVEAQDFTRGIPPEVLEKVKAGDSTAIMEMIQITTRNAYRTAMEHNSKLTEGFVTAREGYNTKGFGERVKGELTSASLASIPGSKNPVVRQQLKQTAESLQRTHPDSTPEEIVAMTLEFHQQLSAELAGEKSKEKKDNNQGGTDWDEWFGS